MLYGYSARQINDGGLLELSEVTIAASPETLRQIVAFLLETADTMEGRELSPYFHTHIGMVIPGWEKQFPNYDLIVTGEVSSPGKDEIPSQ